VQAATSATTATKPNAPITITLHDFAFDSPDTFTSGSNTWAISNNGPMPHEIQVAKLAAGGSSNDVLNFFATPNPSGPPTFQSVGGFQGIDPNLNGTLTLNLPAGDYAFYCAIPDPSNGGKRHLQEGMLKQVTVR
jgi:hypothetical protein